MLVATMNMKELRERAGLSPTGAAFQADVSLSTIRNWEIGKYEPTMAAGQMLKLCRLYGVTLEELVESSAESRRAGGAGNE
jgi:DNA-binding transcriptional regulator YiaG